jgi:hypothetical protein
MIGNATITVNNDAVTNMEGKDVDLNVGQNVITIVVTAEDQVNTKTYTITVTRGS